MKTVSRYYDILIFSLAAIAGIAMSLFFAVIVYDVVLRNMLISPPAWSVPTIEYALLYITMFAGPWLVRTRGHVVVEVLRQSLPAKQRRVLETIVYVLCVAVCAILAWAAADLVIESYVSGEDDVRAITISRVWLYAPLFVGFVLMGCEFARFLFGRGSFYHDDVSEVEGV